MDLLLWRHAQAVDNAVVSGTSFYDGFNNDLNSDWQRPLTAKGRQQAKDMAAWLARHLPANTRVVCSPAVRTCQTAQALTKHFSYQVCPELAPDASTEDLLHLTQWPHLNTTVLVVGHQPTLGLVAQRLLGMQAPAPLKKAPCGGCAAVCETTQRKWFCRQCKTRNCFKLKSAPPIIQVMAAHFYFALTRKISALFF